VAFTKIRGQRDEYRKCVGVTPYGLKQNQIVRGVDLSEESSLEPRTLTAINELVSKINQTKRVDNLLGNPNFESAIYKDYRSKK
jgi:hypothetical protein